MQTFRIMSNAMVKSAQHHRSSLNLFLQQHKFPEVTGFDLGFLLGFFTWTQPQQPVLGTSCRAHFSMVSCRSRRLNYSPLTISPLWAALGISKPSGVAEATETPAANLHWRNRHPSREPASWAPSGPGMLQGREGAQTPMCPDVFAISLQMAAYVWLVLAALTSAPLPPAILCHRCCRPC